MRTSIVVAATITTYIATLVMVGVLGHEIGYGAAIGDSPELCQPRVVQE